MEYGRYRILHPLGQGGMATVYLAEDPLLQRLVAIKVIQAHLSSNSSLMDRFTVEAKTIAALRHVNIVEVFDFGVQDDQQFLVMEYIDGQNLQALCAALAGRPMAGTVAAAIACQAAEGLTSAERHGVVHRDIKPENLMFNSEGQLKIADFGIAHIADEQSRTQTGAVLGSPNFMSPEQIEGLRPTHKTDLFSLGGVLYYCLAGKMPFTGPSIPVTMRNICDRPHPPIPEINPQADPFLVRITDYLLQKQPENRAESARWLANQLRAYLGQQGIVDVAEHCRAFIGTLGLGQNQTLAGPGSGTGSRPGGKTGGKSSLGASLGAPSHVLKAGPTLSGVGDSTPSRSLADQDLFPTQATTGAMGPSSRSPLVWVGALLSVCVLVLAGAILWSRRGADTPPVVRTAERTPDKLPGNTLKNTPASQQGTPASATNPTPAGTGATTGTTTGPTAAGAMGTTLAAQTDPDAATSSRTPATAASALRREAGSGTRHATGTAGASQAGATGRHRERPLPERNAGALKPPSDPSPTPPPVEATGFILIKSAPPFAALTVNGKPQGETPMNAYLEVPVGKCQIEIVHRLSPPFDTVLTITPGFRREYKFKLDR